MFSTVEVCTTYLGHMQHSAGGGLPPTKGPAPGRLRRLEFDARYVTP